MRRDVLTGILLVGLTMVDSAAAASPLAWLRGVAGFDPHHCFAFPEADAPAERALFVCVDADDPVGAADVHLVWRDSRRVVTVETDQSVASNAIDRREGRTFDWLAGWYYQFRSGHPVLPRLGVSLRRAAAWCPDEAERLWIAPDAMLAVSPAADPASPLPASTESPACATLDLQLDGGARQMRVGCVDPAIEPAAAVAGLSALSRALGAPSLDLEAWSLDGRFLRADRFHRDAADPGRPVVDQAAFEARLNVAAAITAIEDLGTPSLAEVYRRLRRALVHAPPIDPADVSPAVATFVQRPEIYLLASTPGATP
ncbi:MAG: hypothetical protein AAGE94_14215 [Acidobacteriota bacterium]